MPNFYDAVNFLATSSGTGDFVVASAIQGYRTPLAAAVPNGATSGYYATSTSGNEWELGITTYATGTVTAARTTVITNHLGTTAKVNFTAAPNVGFVELSRDMLGFDFANSFTTAQKIQAKTNIRVSAPTVQKFITAGAATWNRPTGCTSVRIRMMGGGSGASGSGTGGGNAGTPTASTITTLSLSAGNAAQGKQLAAGNPGGTASGGNVMNINGGTGLIGAVSTGGNAAGAGGAASFYGGAGGGTFGALAGNTAASNSGAGGGCGGITGAVTPGASGGSGGYVEHIVSAPAASYSLVVGAGSAGGTAGTLGNAGGGGADGQIVFDEFYD